LDLPALRTALLLGDLPAAEAAWAHLQSTSIAQDADVQYTGARLALMQGNLDGAKERVWAAIGKQPERAEFWALLGVLHRQLGADRLAGTALGIAAGLDPELDDALIGDRWAIALSTDDVWALVSLAERFADQHPERAMAVYYTSRALIALGEPDGAADILVSALGGMRDTAPALLWFTLAEAYAGRGNHREAAIALETAALMVSHGDVSLTVESRDPLGLLNDRLGRTYLATGQCAEAEAMFRRLAQTDGAMDAWVERAVLCQTPTPTLTPWMPPTWTPWP
jgi:tetratricopeptide (TPR) repeat protein